MAGGRSRGSNASICLRKKRKEKMKKSVLFSARSCVEPRPSTFSSPSTDRLRIRPIRDTSRSGVSVDDAGTFHVEPIYRRAIDVAVVFLLTCNVTTKFQRSL